MKLLYASNGGCCTTSPCLESTKQKTEDKIEDFIVRPASTNEGSPSCFGVSVSTCNRSEISLRAALAPNLELLHSYRKKINYDINI